MSITKNEFNDFRKLKHRYKGYDAYINCFDKYEGNVGTPFFMLVKENEKKMIYSRNCGMARFDEKSV